MKKLWWNKKVTQRINRTLVTGDLLLLLLLLSFLKQSHTWLNQIQIFSMISSNRTLLEIKKTTSTITTLPETNIAGWKIHHFDGIYQERWDFHGRTVSFREGNPGSKAGWIQKYPKGTVARRKANSCSRSKASQPFAWAAEVIKQQKFTPPKINMEPGNDGFQ